MERDVVLPPLKQEIIWLELDDFSRKSYNAMQAIIAINAIDTQRVDVVSWQVLPPNSEYVLTVHRIISFTDGYVCNPEIDKLSLKRLRTKGRC